MNICIFVGARPNFIKIAPIVRAIDKAKAEGKEIGSSLVYNWISKKSINSQYSWRIMYKVFIRVRSKRCLLLDKCDKLYATNIF